MAEFQLVSEYPVRARRLFDTVRKPAFQEALALRFGALEVNAFIVATHDDQVHMRIERVDPRRDLAGGLSAEKTERSIIEHRWDLDRMESRWTRELPDRGRLVSAEGSVRIEVLGRRACRMLEEGTVHIRIPLIGKKLEQRVVDELTEVQPSKVDFIMRQLGCSE